MEFTMKVTLIKLVLELHSAANDGLVCLRGIIKSDYFESLSYEEKELLTKLRYYTDQTVRACSEIVDYYTGRNDKNDK